MPTPIPIRPETAVVQSGTSSALASSGTRPPDEIPRPMRAIASGRPAATTEPNAISSTIAAPKKPTPSGLDCSSARLIGSPPSLISRPSPSWACAASISCVPSSLVTSQPGTVSGRVVVAISPFWETRTWVWPAMLLTCSASARNWLIRRCTAGLCAPAGSLQVTVTSWPE